MNTLIEFIARISIVFYVLAAMGIFFAVRSLVQARRRRRVAMFGLEREAAQARLRRALSVIITLSFLAGIVYVVDNVVAPNTTVAEAEPEEEEAVAFTNSDPTPTAALLLFPTITPTAGLPPAEEPAGEDEPAATEVVNGCEIIGANISSPAPGDEVSGQVSVEGEVNVLNFSEYKFEIKGPSTDDSWVVVGTYYELVPSGLLGVWDSTSLQPGSYTLRLVVHRQDNTVIPPCEVPIVVEETSTTTGGA